MAKARVIDDDDDDDDLPRRKKRRPVNDDDEDEEDERPVSKKKSRVVSDDDDDDDEDDRPVKKKTKKGKKGKPAKNKMMLFMILGGVALLGLMSCAGIGGWYFFLRDSPEIAVKSMISASESKNYGKIYDIMDNSTRSLISSAAKMGNKYPGKSDRDTFIAIMKEAEDKNGGKSELSLNKDGKPIVEGSTITGDTATVTVKFPTGRTETIRCIKQDGSWRISR